MENISVYSKIIPCRGARKMNSDGNSLIFIASCFTCYDSRSLPSFTKQEAACHDVTKSKLFVWYAWRHKFTDISVALL